MRVEQVVVVAVREQIAIKVIELGTLEVVLEFEHSELKGAATVARAGLVHTQILVCSLLIFLRARLLWIARSAVVGVHNSEGDVARFAPLEVVRVGYLAEIPGGEAGPLLDQE